MYSSEAVLPCLSLLFGGTLILGFPSVSVCLCTPVCEGRQTVGSPTWLGDVGSEGNSVLQGPKHKWL